MAELEDSWRAVATLKLRKVTREEMPFAFRHSFTSRIIRTEATVAGVPAHWRRAGYLSQAISTDHESKSVVVPVNLQKIFVMPLLGDFYRLTFTPVQWLPKGLKLRLYEYTGPAPDDDLIKELLLLQ